MAVEEGNQAQGHPIEGLMKTALESIKAMVDVNTVIGEAVETADGTVIIPVSRVSCGFVAGGGEYETGEGGKTLPFGGGSGAGVSVAPIGFLVQSPGKVRFLPVETNAVLERILEVAPELLRRVQRGRPEGGESAPGETPPPTRPTRVQVGELRGGV